MNTDQNIVLYSKAKLWKIICWVSALWFHLVQVKAHEQLRMVTLTHRCERRLRSMELWLTWLPAYPLSRRRDVVNSSRMKLINQDSCWDSRVTHPDIVTSMFQINLCPCFSQYLWLDGITWRCLSLEAGNHDSRHSLLDTSVSKTRNCVSCSLLVHITYILNSQLWNVHMGILNTLLLTDFCFTVVKPIFHCMYLMDTIQSSMLRKIYLLQMNTHQA